MTLTDCAGPPSAPHRNRHQANRGDAALWPDVLSALAISAPALSPGCQIAIDGEIAVIPDLEYLQTQLEQQLDEAA